jgi:hypothetical protein
MKTSRRTFLHTAAGTTALAALASRVEQAHAQAGAAPAMNRTPRWD